MSADPPDHADDEPTADGFGSTFDVGSVSGSVGASISDPQAPVHAGAGDLHVYYQGTIREAARQSLRWVTDDQEKELEPRFVVPPGWEEARRLLLERRVVLLRGEPGSGRRSAALRLLGECREEDSGHIQELQWESEPGFRLLDPADVTAGSRMILDLSEAEGEQFQTIQRELETFRGAVQEQGAFLVVVMHARWQHRVRDEFRSLAVRLERPDALEVLCRHLLANGIGCAPAEIARSPHVAGIHGIAMREIARLAQLAREARQFDPSASLEDLLKRAEEAFADRSADVAAWVKAHPSGPARALMLATAMFADSPADAVFEADRLLVGVLRYQLGDLHELQRPDLGSRLERIGAEMDAAGRVRFTSLNYADAARVHFWTHFPGLRAGFRDWVIACAGLRDVDQGFVDRYGSQCLRVGRPEDLITAAKAWATERPINGPLAEKALVHGLFDEQWGARFRRQLYDWSRDRNLHPGLAYAVILVCGGVLARSWPGPAMVRLHHLTGHGDTRVAQAAEDTLAELATSEAMFLRRLLRRLNEEDFRRLEMQRSRRLFIRVADPHRLADGSDRTRSLIDDSAVRRELVAAWRSVFTNGETAEYDAAVGQWLQAHAEGCGDVLLVVLAEACRGEVGLLATLFAYGRRWLGQARAVEGSARATVRRLEAAIDQVRESRREEP